MSRAGRSAHRDSRLAVRYAAGYSLIELMVAILIALFLIGGVLIVEQGVHQSHSDNSALAQIDDEERFTLTLLSELVREGGYYPDPTAINQDTALPQQDVTASDGDQLNFNARDAVYGVSVAGATGSTTPGLTTDSLAVRFMTANNDGIPLCDGTSNQTGSDQIYINYLYVPSSGGLYCEVGRASPGNPTQISWDASGPIELVKDVQDMQIWYGLSSSTSGSDNNVVEYVPAASMSAADWADVTSVKLLLTFTNPLAAEPGQSKVLLFTLVADLMGRTGP